MGKRKLQDDKKDPRDGPEEPEMKLSFNSYQNSYQMKTEEIDIIKTHLQNEGLVLNIAFTSKIQSQSFQQIKHRIKEQDELVIGTKKFHIYAAFKEALLRCIMQIEEILSDERNKVKILLFHGVPKIGITSLAQCLSYFLGFYADAGKTVNYLQFSHSARMDTDDVLTNKITDAFMDEYLIVDQVNTHSLVAQDIFNSARSRANVYKYKMPVIMFTSGHYSPNEKFMKFRRLHLLDYKVIAMKIDASVVGKLRKSDETPEDIDLSNNQLLNVTNVYSRMVLCLHRVSVCDYKLNEDDLRNEIFPRGYLEQISRDSAIPFLWLAWHELISKGLPPIGEEFKHEDCKIKPQHAEYLAFLNSDIKLKRDRGRNALLNQMDICGHTLYEQNGYTEFDPNGYYYTFLNKKVLFDILSRAFSAQALLSPEKRLNISLDAFNMLRKTEDSLYNCVKGGLFELLIRYICEGEAELLNNPVGMLYQSVQVCLDFIRVDESVKVATSIDLCNLPMEHDMCKKERSTFWCVLNVPGHKPFKGYDFAYMVTMPHQNQPMVEKLQLFQVTINPNGKSQEKKMIMTDVLQEIKKELVERKLIKDSADVNDVVVPYFVHPWTEHEKISLPYRDDPRKIAVDIIGFPQKRFKIK